jgi:hypothetical protein
VRFTLRVVRVRSGVSSSRSRRATDWLTAEGETPSSRAAREKLLFSATARKTERWPIVAEDIMNLGYIAPSTYTTFSKESRRGNLRP